MDNSPHSSSSISIMGNYKTTEKPCFLIQSVGARSSAGTLMTTFKTECGKIEQAV